MVINIILELHTQGAPIEKNHASGDWHRRGYKYGNTKKFIFQFVTKTVLFDGLQYENQKESRWVKYFFTDNNSILSLEYAGLTNFVSLSN